MKSIILVINAGSSSIKYKVFDVTSNNVLANGQCEKIGNPMGIFSLKYNGKKIEEELPISDHQVGIKIILDELQSKGIIHDLNEIKGIGHRIVMGGTAFPNSTVVTDDVLKQLKAYIPLAPLHNPPEIETIEVFKKLLPNVKNVTVYDTSFHTTIPEFQGYALNKEVMKKYQIKRYGAHGTSYRYITNKMQNVLGKDKVNLVVCHLGNGASICAIKDSKSFNTTMGVTPLEGLVMGTRCGDIDPSIALYLIRNGMTADQVDNLFNKESGLKGLVGTNDLREIVQEIANNNQDAIMAMETFSRRVAKYIVAYANELEGKIDGIIFTAGIGENNAKVLNLIFDKLHLFKLSINQNALSEQYSDYKLISNNESAYAIYQVRTDEELMIEQDVKTLLKL